MEGVFSTPRPADSLVRVPHVAIANGAGMAFAQTLVLYADLFSEATGPGVYYLPQCPQMSLMLVSAILCMMFATMQMLWSMILFSSFRQASWFQVALAVASHLVASLMTLLTGVKGGCVGVILVEAAIGVALGVVVYRMRY
eukprot:TRINITY_DN26990_c0_g1_i1.p1 TRINITY_DN26990_c0_g1~~TRINITY_DN26990_c0_g1_i1.p1  ORF type:complete len:141 (+),score=21.61 TRINITY_DN26990_c0_g1_i1:262-684(+)